MVFESAFSISTNGSDWYHVLALYKKYEKFVQMFQFISFRNLSVSMATTASSVGTLVGNVMKVNREQKKGSEGMPFVRPSFPLIDRDSVAI